MTTHRITTRELSSESLSLLLPAASLIGMDRREVHAVRQAVGASILPSSRPRTQDKLPVARSGRAF